MKGVLRTRVGYCGGEKETPTYYSLGDHTEAMSIDYDPSVTSYDAMLALFWDAHRCERNNTSRQYINALFPRNAAQAETAKVSLAARAAQLGIAESKVATEIIPIERFTYAEGYHHKYYLTRHADLRGFLERTYPSEKAFADSTAGTRLNAYLGSGVGLDWPSFLAELPSYGLPESLEANVRSSAR